MMDAFFLRASPNNPWGFHFTNIFLHSINAALLFFLFYAVTKKMGLSFFCAAIWAIHPLRVESVAWVSERKDVLSGFFALLSVWAYVLAYWLARNKSGIGVQTGKYIFLLLSLLSYTLGLLTKPSDVPLPLFFLLLDVWPLKRLSLTWDSFRRTILRLVFEKTPFFIVSLFSSYFATHAHGLMFALEPTPLWERICSIPLHYVFYLGKSLLPRQLSPLYVALPIHGFLVGGAIILLGALSIGVWIFRRRWPNVLIGWLTFVIMLIPVIGLVRFGVQSIADRFTYLPAMGLSLALLFINPMPGLDRVRQVRFGLGLLILCALWIQTARLLPSWKSPGALHARILSLNPDNPIAMEMHAYFVLRTTGDFQTAYAYYNRIYQSGEFSHSVLCGLAQCLAELETPAEAKAFLLHAPDTSNPYTKQAVIFNIARYSLQQKEYDDALQYAEMGLQILPSKQIENTLPFHLLSMVAAFEKGDISRALSHASQFPPYAHSTSLTLLDMLPYYLYQWNDLHRRDAWNYFQRLFHSYPDRPALLNNIVWGLSTANWSPVSPDIVVSLAEQIGAIHSGEDAGILDTMAAAHANAGDFTSAIRTLEFAISLFPDSHEVLETDAFKCRLLSRLKTYQHHQPYRENAFARLWSSQFVSSNPIPP
ncbi:MAG: hypothetical protein LBN38_06175 [Verrucomicrobiota bacterium]|nr:hypothetical protein [Verrucomicrobiota bacterium]